MAGFCANRCHPPCKEDINLEEFKTQRFPRLNSIRSKQLKINQSAYTKGQEDGVKIVLHKGVSHEDGYGGKLLT